MLYNETNNFDEIKTLFPDKTEIEVVIRPCLPRADHRVPGGLILRKLMVCFPIIRFFSSFDQIAGNFRRVRCLHCIQVVRRGKPGCSTREASNSGMASHMRTKHYWVPIHISASLFPVFCLNARNKFAACLYLSVLPITFSRITLKKFRRLFKNEVNLKICPKITSFNFSLDKWYLRPNFPSVFHSQVIAQEKCFPSWQFIAVSATQRKLQVTRKG